MAKKPTRKSLTKKLDTLCREIIRLMYNNRCAKCHKCIEGSNSHPHHIIAKGCGASWRRFDLNNIILLCHHHHQWWHNNPIESKPWFDETFPARMPYLVKYTGGKPVKISTQEMLDLIENYTNKLTVLRKEG